MRTERSHLDWYMHAPEYAHVPREFASPGDSGVTLLRSYQPPGCYRRPAADDLTLQLLHAGGMPATVDHGARFRCSPVRLHDLALSPPATDLTYDVAGDLPALVAVMPCRFLEAALSGEKASWKGDFGRLHASLFRDDTIASLLQRVWRETEAGSPRGGLFADAAWSAVATLLLTTATGSSQEAQPTRGGLAPWQLRRVCAAMDSQLGRDVGLVSLARIADCSPTHLSRAFKASTGIPPFTWLLRRRIERAKELLADPGVPLAEVTLAVGFSAQPQFTTAFRRVTGTTPGAWRRERLR